MTRRFAAGVLLLAGLGAAPTAMAQDRNYVAVVVGLSAYKNLPSEVHLDYARSDAATVAQALKDNAHFNQVFLLRDAEATREGIRETMRTKAAQFLGPNDVFVLYFAGHGVGADLDTPVLLAYDSTLANGQEDGLELAAFTRDIQTWTRAGTTLVVTDAIHRNQLDGIYFYGPAATQWPAMPQNTLLITASSVAEPGRDGAFGQVFAQGMSGGADTNSDRQVSAMEMSDFITKQMTGSGQTPVTGGNYDPNMVLARNVSGNSSVVYLTEGTMKPPEPIYPDIFISAAKFVWMDGVGQSVTCRSEPVMACSPSCYVRNFRAGPCEIQATMDGVQMKGTVVVLQAGKYDCRRHSGNLICTGPSP